MVTYSQDLDKPNTPPDTPAKNYRAFLAMFLVAPLLTGCLDIEVIGKDISDRDSATIVCTGDAPGTIAFALVGDGSLSSPGPTAVANPNFRATTRYIPTPGTGVSRDVRVTCTFTTAQGKVETKTGKVIVRETMNPELVASVVPATAEVGKAFDVTATVRDPKTAPAGMVGWAGGIDSVGMVGAGAVRAVPIADKEFDGVRPGPPTHPKGPEAPPQMTFIAECMRVGAGSISFHIIDAAGNFLFTPDEMIECAP